MRKKLLCVLLGGICLLVVNVSQAAEIALDNADFSLPAIPASGYNSHGSLAPTWGDKPGELLMGNQHSPMPAGPEIVAYYNAGGAGPKAGIWQITEELISLNAAYTFTINAALRDGGTCKLYIYAVDPALETSDPNAWTLIGESEFAQSEISGTNPNVNEPISTTVEVDGSQIALLGQKLAVGAQAFDNIGQFFADKAQAEVNTLPGAAWAPEPYSGEQGVLLDTLLKWKAGSDPNLTGHDLYIGTDPFQVAAATAASHPGVELYSLAASDPNMSYDLATDLLDSTIYYWRVDETLSDPGIIAGMIWGFETIVYAITDPVPAHEATEVDPIDPSLALAWTPGSGGPYDFNVYFGTAPGALTEISHEQPETSLAIGPLEWATTYYWVIDQVDQGTGHTIYGVPLEFTTIVPVCDPPLLGDADGDCNVTMSDFAIVAAEWLSCNWVPVEACQ